MVEPTDEELIRSLASGREESFRLLLRRHEAPVRSFLARRLDRIEDAEEAAQDVFLKVQRSARTFNGRAAFLPWLHAISRNVLRDRLRAVRRERVVPLEADPAAGVEIYRLPQSVEEVREALGALPRKYRAALSLRYLAGLSYREAASELGLSTRGFETRLVRAKTLLRAALTRRRRRDDGLPGA